MNYFTEEITEKAAKYESNPFIEPLFWISIASMIVAIAAIVTSILIARRQKRTTILSLFNETLKPACEILKDILFLLNSMSFSCCEDIKRADNDLVVKLLELEHYAKAERYMNLSYFASMRLDETKASWSFQFCSIEDEYLKFRLSHTSGFITEQDKKELNKYYYKLTAMVSIAFENFKLLSKRHGNFEKRDIKLDKKIRERICNLK